MSAIAICLACAVFVLPPSRGRRRFGVLVGRVGGGRNIPVRWVFRICVGLLAAGAAVLGTGPLLSVVLLGATVGVRRRRARRLRYRDTECAALLDGLEVVIGELRVGAHPSAAAAVAATEVEGIAGRAFAVSAARGRLGGSVESGLRAPGTVIAAELGRIADVWQVADRHGVALAELLAAARSDLSGRIRFRARTAAALAGARASAAVLSGLPLLGIALGQLMGAAPLRILLGAGAGTILLPLGTGLICAGLLWTDAITAQVTS